MQEERFRELLDMYFLPMLSGTTLGTSTGSSAAHSIVAYENPCSLFMKPEKAAAFRVRLQRSQAFTPEEKELANLFGEEFALVASAPQSLYLDDLMSALPRRVIARLLATRNGQSTLQQAIHQFESFASQTYEGNPVVAALGVTGSVGHGPIRLNDLWKEDFSVVLSNGFDSIYVCGSDGRAFNLEYLAPGPTDLLAPHRLASIAAWCDRHKRRAALVLNRNGEILVFGGETLQFAKRRGHWRYYAHHAMISRLGPGLEKKLRHAIYESCLDVSFARTGGCIAVVNAPLRRDVTRAVRQGDLIEREENTRTKLLSAVIKKKPFHLLDRRLRQELLAVDGATVLSHDGEVLTAGAIVKLPGGSSGGGRRAAAVELSRLGLGVKISADGPIAAFRNRQIVFSM